MLLVPVMAFGLYRRVRRTFGRQQVRRGRMIFRMAMLTLVSAVFVLSSPTAVCLGAATAGAALGIGLAVLGLVHTRYERDAKGVFYTGHPWIGLLVTALFLGRLVARFASLSATTAAATSAAGSHDFPMPLPFGTRQITPLTVGIFLVMSSYYVALYAGVLRRARALAATSGAPGAATLAQPVDAPAPEEPAGAL